MSESVRDLPEKWRAAADSELCHEQRRAPLRYCARELEEALSAVRIDVEQQKRSIYTGQLERRCDELQAKLKDSAAEVARLEAERPGIVSEWKATNGYDDLLKAYSGLADERNAAQMENAELRRKLDMLAGLIERLSAGALKVVR